MNFSSSKDVFTENKSHSITSGREKSKKKKKSNAVLINLIFSSSFCSNSSKHSDTYIFNQLLILIEKCTNTTFKRGLHNKLQLVSLITFFFPKGAAENCWQEPQWTMSFGHYEWIKITFITSLIQDFLFLSFLKQAHLKMLFRNCSFPAVKMLRRKNTLLDFVVL